ncbi:MAG: hypothetical protein RMJ97_06155 [Raineya sp.]|nr:hypothetical protein [Raineya sp.]
MHSVKAGISQVTCNNTIMKDNVQSKVAIRKISIIVKRTWLLAQNAIFSAIFFIEKNLRQTAIK